MTAHPFQKLSAIAAPIDEANVDTNQICPTRFNKLARDDPYYSKVLFHNQRFDQAGEPVADFVLNRAPFDQARILVADRNWGCGSSRESAVYALAAFGIQVVIAPSFGDIHYSNALKNGLLPVILPRAVCDDLRAALHAAPGSEIAVDLEAQTVVGPDGAAHEFEIQASRKRALLLGQDEIAMTGEYREQIEAFERLHAGRVPWLGIGAEG